MIYERRPSPLHAARAWVGAVWCMTLGLVALSIEQPVVLGALLAACWPPRPRRTRGAGSRSRSRGACRSRS